MTKKCFRLGPSNFLTGRPEYSPQPPYFPLSPLRHSFLTSNPRSSAFPDLFEEMIVKTPLTACFPEYEGEGGALPALDYIKSKYQKIMDEEMPGKKVHISVIAARVRMDMKIAEYRARYPSAASPAPPTPRQRSAYHSPSLLHPPYRH